MHWTKCMPSALFVLGTYVAEGPMMLATCAFEITPHGSVGIVAAPALPRAATRVSAQIVKTVYKSFIARLCALTRPKCVRNAIRKHPAATVMPAARMYVRIDDSKLGAALYVRNPAL